MAHNHLKIDRSELKMVDDKYHNKMMKPAAKNKKVEEKDPLEELPDFIKYAPKPKEKSNE